ncbi:GNAT family N-acetyltransferase [Bacillus suaedaesalsae]|uniref:GNAT family N-acetyltransferase n=1 Tax=Bacillus suaedaesalsae TaxID=2810349 RepID=A0ABS2DI46_9BACI|nr:GNAT family N-acetyltransferase [Bacillus suaedaesalsae]MBM6618123.1 GNAT family N-acetyltransferase [Bacillus suaedaesalsae]
MIQLNEITIKPLEQKDATFIAKWLSDPKVLEYYEGRDNPFTINKVYEKFYKENDTVKRNLVLVNDSPVGYIQYYRLDPEGVKKYGYNDNELIYGLDQFIGEVQHWGSGLGTKLVTIMKDFLFNVLNVDRIVMDPQAWNTRAIRCYEKCGFTKVKLLPKNEWHEGEYRDCWLIECTK